jgi:hypothetical protein
MSGTITKTPRVHLFRGAPAVRSWLKHQETVEDWTLCGIQRTTNSKGGESGRHCVEDASLVSCPYCVKLMHPTACILAKTGCSFCEAKAKSKPRSDAASG